MKSRRATLQAPIRRFFAELSKLYGHRWQLVGHLEDRRKRVLKRIEENTGDGWVAGGFTLYTISDVTYFPPNRFRVSNPVGRFQATNQGYVDVLDELIRRINDWTVARAFELFQTFLRDSVAARLYVEPALLSTYMKKPPKVARNHIQEWKRIARLRRPNLNKRQLKWLASQTPKLRYWEQKNNRNVDLRAWFHVWQEVRHASTHNDGRIKGTEVRKWSEYQRRVQKHFFPTKTRNRERVLWLDKETTEACLEYAGEYAFLIFKMQAQALGVEWQSIVPEPYTTTKGNR